MIKYADKILRSYNNGYLIVIEVKTKNSNILTLYFNINSPNNGWRESTITFNDWLLKEEKVAIS